MKTIVLALALCLMSTVAYADHNYKEKYIPCMRECHNDDEYKACLVCSDYCWKKLKPVNPHAPDGLCEENVNYGVTWPVL